MGSHLTLPQTIFLVLAALGSVLLANCETFVAPKGYVPAPIVIATRAIPKSEARLQPRAVRQEPAGHRPGRAPAKLAR